MKYFSCKEISELTNISIRRLQQMCQNNEIPNSKKENGIWYIPKTFLNTFVIDNNIKPVPVGITDYEKICTSNYIVDKSLLIKDIIDNGNTITLFTRPRRFGKTLNMSMLKTFFEISDKDTSIYFKDKLIWKCGAKYIVHQGIYPVIYITFKDAKSTSFESQKELLIELIIDEYKRHLGKINLSLLSRYDVDLIDRIISKKASDIEYQMSLYTLSRILYLNYNQSCIVIIDEYDSPIQTGYFNGYYDNIINYIRTLFSFLLKDNAYISYGFLTGILRIAKESIFSGLNNLYVDTILSENYSKYFGFTENEVLDLLKYYNAENQFHEIKDWYDGYKFGSTEIYNPWSLTCYILNKFKAAAYWLSTSSNDIISEFIDHRNDEITANLYKLLNQNSIETKIVDNIIYPQITSNPDSIFSFLLMTGYLKYEYDHNSGEYLVKIPNKEIHEVYREEIIRNLKLDSIGKKFKRSILNNDFDTLKSTIAEYLNSSMSIFDSRYEAFYHGMMLGLSAILTDEYNIKSNRESGLGLYDMVLMPKNINNPALLFEFKTKTSSKKALSQIIEKEYTKELESNGYKNVILVGMQFNDKNVDIEFEVVDLSNN